MDVNKSKRPTHGSPERRDLFRDELADALADRLLLVGEVEVEHCARSGLQQSDRFELSSQGALALVAQRPRRRARVAARETDELAPVLEHRDRHAGLVPLVAHPLFRDAADRIERRGESARAGDVGAALAIDAWRKRPCRMWPSQRPTCA